MPCQVVDNASLSLHNNYYNEDEHVSDEEPPGLIVSDYCIAHRLFTFPFHFTQPIVTERFPQPRCFCVQTRRPRSDYRNHTSADDVDYDVVPVCPVCVQTISRHHDDFDFDFDLAPSDFNQADGAVMESVD